MIPTCGRPGVERGCNPSKRKFEGERVAKLLHFGAARINFQFQTKSFHLDRVSETICWSNFQNSFLLMHFHRSITDTLNTVKIAERFACTKDRPTHRTFWKTWVGVCVRLDLWEPANPTPPTFQNASLDNFVNSYHSSVLENIQKL